MANAAQIPVAQRRDSLRLMLESRGLSPAEATAHVARMSDAAVTEDLTFHLREDAASKRIPPSNLPLGELFAHYTGPLHRLDDAAANDAARGVTRAPGATRPPASPGPREPEAGLDPRYVAGAAVGALALAVVVFIAARAALRSASPAPELDAPARPVTPARRGPRGR